MAVQQLIVDTIVALCATYAGWTLMPAALRRRVATALLRWPLPSALTAPLRRAARPGSACGCSGCDAAAPTTGRSPGQPQPVRLHRRPRR